MKYDWIEKWAVVPATDNGRTHGVCVTKNGNVVVFHQAVNGLLTFDPDGKLISATGGDRWLGAHGLAMVAEDGEEFLWLTDQESREVAKVTLAGETVMRIGKPDHQAYGGADAQDYIPTWAAQNPSNGEVWVADGYGASLVHRYDRQGNHLATIDGTEGVRRFDCPHAINFACDDEGNPELYITDRANRLIVVYDAEGRFLRQSTACHSPCSFDFLGDRIVVAELFTGVKVLDKGTLDAVAEYGASEIVLPRDGSPWYPPVCPEGWPNLAGTGHVRPGVFNSPHAACFAPNADIYVVEWIVGGRITKLARAAGSAKMAAGS